MTRKECLSSLPGTWALRLPLALAFWFTRFEGEPWDGELQRPKLVVIIKNEQGLLSRAASLLQSLYQSTKTPRAMPHPLQLVHAPCCCEGLTGSELRGIDLK
jgi:hypothetical protein